MSPRRTATEVIGHVVDYTENGDIGTEANARALTAEIVEALRAEGYDVA